MDEVIHNLPYTCINSARQLELRQNHALVKIASEVPTWRIVECCRRERAASTLKAIRERSSLVSSTRNQASDLARSRRR